MGGTGKKLQDWCQLEFGTTGSCFSCAERWRKFAAVYKQPAKTPCESCPKHKLYPSNFGLHPANELAVNLYRMAAREDLRVGMGGVLAGTISIPDVEALIRLYSDRFPTPVRRVEILEKILLIDRIATLMRSKEEARQREIETKKVK